MDARRMTVPEGVRECGDAAHGDADACEAPLRRIICRMDMQRGPVDQFHRSGCLPFMLSTATSLENLGPAQ
jgi:hypothetical protein